MIAERNPQVAQAVVKLRELSADERARDLYERREKARRDQAMWKRWERQQGLEQGLQQGIEQGLQQGGQARAISMARNMIADGEPVGKIIKYTGLTLKEIESIDDAG